MKNENEKIIQFGNSLNPNGNLNNNTNQPNMNEQNNSIPSDNQNFTMNNQQIINQENINTQGEPNKNINQPTYSNYSQENLNNFNNNIISNNNDKKKKSNTKVTIIIIVAVLVIYILFRLITSLTSYNAVNSVIDNTRASSFVSDAKSYVQNARFIVGNEEASGKLKYSPSCSIDNSASKIILKEIVSNSGNMSSTSPFGKKYDLDSSFIKVISKITNNSCDYEYYIYLTDGTYSIGTPSNPILYNDLNSNNIKKEK